MAIVVQSAQSQSSSALIGQSTTYIKGLVLMQISSVPDTLVDAVLQQVLREFYTKSQSWRDTLGPFYISQGLDTVQFNPIDQYSLLLNVFGAYLYPTPANSGRTWLYLDSEQMVGTDVAQPVRMAMRTPDTGVLYPLPDKSYGPVLYILGSLKPVINTTQLPTIATEQHLDGLVSGVLSKLYAIPQRPWTDKETAKMHDRIYRREILLAKDQANRAYSSADSRRVFPSFAGRGSQRLTRTF